MMDNDLVRIFGERGARLCGLHRVRHYGLANARSKRSIEELRLLIAIALNRLHYLACTEQLVMAQPMSMSCPHCGGPMLSVGFVPPPVESRWSLAAAEAGLVRASP